jgi:hypothetical protein
MKIHKMSETQYAFWCPGCNQVHTINHTWEYNGDSNKPTISPSILVKGIEDLTDREYNLMRCGALITPVPTRCHSFIKDGKIQFLGDCTHKLTGQTVDLPEWK